MAFTPSRVWGKGELSRRSTSICAYYSTTGQGWLKLRKGGVREKDIEAARTGGHARGSPRRVGYTRPMASHNGGFRPT